MAPTTGLRNEWPFRLFKLRGFGRVEVKYDSTRDVNVVHLARQCDGQPIKVDLPRDFGSMTLEAFRNWVDDEVEKIMGPSDFPAIPFSNTGASPRNG